MVTRFSDIRKTHFKLGEPVHDSATPRMLSIWNTDGKTLKIGVDKELIPQPMHNRASRRRSQKPLRPMNFRRRKAAAKERVDNVSS